MPQSSAHVIPTDLESPLAKLVYLAIANGEKTRPGELKSQLDLPLMTILGVIDHLDSREYIRPVDGGYTIDGMA